MTRVALRCAIGAALLQVTSLHCWCDPQDPGYTLNPSVMLVATLLMLILIHQKLEP